MEKTDAIKLLAIDDKPDNLITLSAVVRKTLPQTRVLTANNGPAGIELAAAEDPDVILLDILMPGMDGFEVCRRLKADDRLKDIPVVFLTALKTDTASRVKALSAGGEGFLAKPLETAELTAQIQAMAKVKRANRSQRTEKDRLEALVAERTRELELELTERKQAEEALWESEARYRGLFANSHDAIMTLEPPTWAFTSGNLAALEMFGAKTEPEFTAHKPWKLSPELQPDGRTSNEKAREMIETAMRDGARFFEWTHRRINGEEFHADVVLSRVSSAGKSFIQATVRDITERKEAEIYREMGREVLQILNEPGDLQETIRRVLDALKTRTGFDAVGLRLQEGEDFPYFAQDGFPADFLLAENTLLKRDKDGGVCRDKDGNVCLECTCGLVISGKTDPANPLFTKGGSCWTNDSFPLLDLPSDQDPRLHPRNNCIHQGYASVALIPVAYPRKTCIDHDFKSMARVPIQTKDRIVGLIQLNDKRKDRFTLETIEILEGIAAHIGSTLMRKQAEKKMAEQLHDLQRWHNVMLDREGRVIELKREVNELLAKAGKPPRYLSAERHLA